MLRLSSAILFILISTSPPASALHDSVGAITIGQKSSKPCTTTIEEATTTMPKRDAKEVEEEVEESGSESEEEEVAAVSSPKKKAKTEESGEEDGSDEEEEAEEKEEKDYTFPAPTSSHSFCSRRSPALLSRRRSPFSQRPHTAAGTCSTGSASLACIWSCLSRSFIAVHNDEKPVVHHKL